MNKNDMTAFDNTWSALLRPGEARRWFAYKPLPPFEARAAAYHGGNAWWLAELARLVYKQDAHSRAELLHSVGLHETLFLDRGSIQAALFSTLPEWDTPFTALVFRGSEDLRDWALNIQALPAAWKYGGRVHYGFQQALAEVWKELRGPLRRLPPPVFYAGHSLGGALAVLAASRLPPDAVYTFGAPRAGNRDFAKALAHLPLYRCVNRGDIVPRLPLPGPPADFYHAGELHYLSGGGQRWIEPKQLRLLKDWMEQLRQTDESTFNLSSSAPAFLADHAPVNYVARLEALLEL